MMSMDRQTGLLDLSRDPLAGRAGRRGGTGRPALSGTPALLLLASLTVSMLAASGAPTPLYAIYQQHWGFTPITTTVIFGIYAITVLVALLVFGRLSDYTGRRPVLLAAIAVQAASLAVFATAGGVGDLIAARVIQGISAGAALGAIGAGMLDIDRERGALANALTPGMGTGTGVLLSSLAVQFLPAPTRLIYLVLLGVLAVQAAGVALLRETVTRSPGALRSLVPDISLPRSVRGPMLAAAPVVFAVWALAGLNAALGPELVHALTGSASVLAGGADVTLMTVAAITATYTLRNTGATAVMLAGIAALIAGSLIVLAALGTGSAALLFLGTAVSGYGFGAGFQGGIRTVVPAAAPHERAGVLSLLFVLSYLGLGVPVVIAGYAAVHGQGLVGAARDYALCLIALAAFALAALARSSGNRRREHTIRTTR
jgi:Major Facilitator Superfamily